MKVYDTLTGVGAVAANKAQSQGSQGQNGFELLFAEVSRRSVAETTFDAQSNRRDDDRSRTRTSESRTERTDRTTRREDTSRRRTEDSSTVAEAPVANETPPATNEQSNAPDEVKIDEEQAIVNIAEVLQVPVEVIIDLMEQEGISAQDLLDSQAVLKLIQMAKGAEDPTALLTDPEFPEQFKAINEAMVELAKEAEVALAIAAQTTEVGAKVQDQLTKAYATDIEGLEVINEDGKLVVTDRTAGDEVYADTTKTQSTQGAETATTEQQTQLGGGQVQESPGATLPTMGEVIMDDAVAINPTLQVDTAKPQVEMAKPATPTPTLNATDVIEQIMSQVRVTQVGGQFTEMRMTLRPETLGDIVLRVLTQNGIVIAQFEAESQRVKEALEANFNQLRDALEEQGIAFSELSVSVRQDENERMNQLEQGRQRVRNRIDSVNGEETPEETKSIDPYHTGFIDITA